MLAKMYTTACLVLGEEVATIRLLSHARIIKFNLRGVRVFKSDYIKCTREYSESGIVIYLILNPS